MTIQLTKEERIIAEQRVKIEELQEKISLIKEDIQPVNTQYPREWQLTMQQSRMLTLLYNSDGTVKREYFYRVLETKSINPARLLKVVMVKLRRRVKPFGIEIHNHWNVGYWIDEEAKAIIKSALSAGG